MLLLPLRWLIWLLALSVPAQASAGAWMRAHAPAHIHVGAVGDLHGRSDVQVKQQGRGHAHGHAGSRIAPHEHELAEAGVLYVNEARDGDRGGTPQPADKASALESPALLPASFIECCDRFCTHARAPASPAYASVPAQPLYRPPR
ncbi:MAG: hypothetical protein ABIO45_18715 [Burkholderiaceae bacterium]